MHPTLATLTGYGVVGRNGRVGIEGSDCIDWNRNQTEMFPRQVPSKGKSPHIRSSSQT